MRTEKTSLQDTNVDSLQSPRPDASWQDALTANSGIDVQAIRDAIGRLESEAKATVAAENRARAEARARALAEERARIDSAAGKAAHASALAAEQAIAAAKTLLESERQARAASEQKTRAIQNEIAAIAARTAADATAAQAAQIRTAAEQIATERAHAQAHIDDAQAEEAERSAEQLALAAIRNRQLAEQRSVATQSALIETENRASADVKIIEMARDFEQRERHARLAAATLIEAKTEALAITAQREQAEAVELDFVLQRTAADAIAREETNARIAAEQDRQRTAAATVLSEQRIRTAIEQHHQRESAILETVRRREHAADLALTTSQARLEAEETILQMHERSAEIEAALQAAAEMRNEAETRAQIEQQRRLLAEQAATAAAANRLLAEQEATAAALLRITEEQRLTALAAHCTLLEQDAEMFAMTTAAAERQRMAATADYADLQECLASLAHQNQQNAQALAVAEKKSLEAAEQANDALQSRLTAEQAAVAESRLRANADVMQAELLRHQTHADLVLRVAQEAKNAACEVVINEANKAAILHQQAADVALESAHNAIALTHLAATRLESEQNELASIAEKVLQEERLLLTSQKSAAALQRELSATKVAEHALQMRLTEQKKQGDLLLQQVTIEQHLRLSNEAASAVRLRELQNEAERVTLLAAQADGQAIDFEQRRIAAAEHLHTAAKQRLAAEQKHLAMLQGQADEAEAIANTTRALANIEEDTLLAMQQKNQASQRQRSLREQLLQVMRQKRVFALETEQALAKKVTHESKFLENAIPQEKPALRSESETLPPQKNATGATASMTTTLDKNRSVRSNILQETAQLHLLHAQVGRELLLTSQAEEKLNGRFIDA